MIFDLGDSENFSTDYMDAVRFVPCFRGVFWGVIIHRCIHIAGKYGNQPTRNKLKCDVLVHVYVHSLLPYT